MYSAIGDNPSIHFCYLNKLTKQFNLEKLSMGMSGDYEQAIKFGADYLRIGTDFLGIEKIIGNVHFYSFLFLNNLY